MTPLIPVALVGTGLFFLFRKKPPGPTPMPVNSVAAALAPGALSVPAPASAQSAADAAIVDEAFTQFAKEQGAKIQADPILFERPEPRVPTSAPSLSSADIPSAPQSQEVESPGLLDVANSVFNPFASGNVFGDD